jgi:phospholipase D1/2
VESPGAKASWEAIQKRAKQNTDLYEAAFDFIPRNKDVLDKTPEYELRKSASIWPRWHKTDQKDKDGHEIWAHSAPMPFEASFWTSPQFNATAATKLNEIKGFITLLPIEWTKGENNNLGYPTALVAKVEPTANPLQPTTKIGQADVSITPTTEGKT